MLRRLYDRVIALAATRWATPALAVISFAEASFFPAPPDVLLAPMVLARRERAWFYAFVCSAASIAGAFLGYAIGYWLQPLGETLLRVFGDHDGMEAYRAGFAKWGAVVILAKGLTPIPFKLITIASGLARFDLLQFTLAVAVTRSGRFFLEAALLQHPRVKAVVERHLIILVIVGLLAIVAAVVALKFVAHR